MTWNSHFPDYCHMWSNENDLDELHAFAAKLRLRLTWFQGQHANFPHYDISLPKRNMALKLGATEKRLVDWIAEQKNNL